MAGEISNNIFAKCLPAYSTDIDRCGAVTLCNISPTGTDELASIYKDGSDRYRIIGALLEADFMGKACNVRQNGMYDLIQATRREFGVKRLGAQRINNGLWEIMPFVKMGRKHPINNEFWSVSSGSGAGGTTPNTGESYAYSCVVTSQTGINADIRWFPARTRVFIMGVTAGGTAIRTAYRVLDATVSGANVTLYCASENANSNLTAPKVANPTTGVLVRGTPNVSDYEKYCAQIPGLNTTQLTPFWIETVRHSICDDELYRKYVGAIRQNNPYFRTFGDVESVELNRQIIEDFQRRDAYTFFFNKPLANQDLVNYDSLEQITVYSDDSYGNYMDLPFEGRCVGRRANAVGVYEQLAECGRVKDLQAQQLSIPELQKALYEIIRVRKANGIPVQVIEMFTDSYYAVQLAQGFLRYFKDRSEGLLRLNQDLMSKMGSTEMGFHFQEFQLDYPAVKVRIVTHEFFDDLLSAHTNVSTNLTAAGRFLWIMDWTTIYKGVVESNSVNLQSGDIKRLAEVNDDYLCVMKVPKKSQRLTSETRTFVVECPQASLLLENIAETVPEHTDTDSNVDYYYA